MHCLGFQQKELDVKTKSGELVFTASYEDASREGKLCKDFSGYLNEIYGTNRGGTEKIENKLKRELILRKDSIESFIVRFLLVFRNEASKMQEFENSLNCERKNVWKPRDLSHLDVKSSHKKEDL